MYGQYLSQPPGPMRCLKKRQRTAGMEFEVESAGTHAYHAGENADSRMRRTAATRRSFHSTIMRDISGTLILITTITFLPWIVDITPISSIGRGAAWVTRLRMFREFDPLWKAESDDLPDPYYGGQAKAFEQRLRYCRTYHQTPFWNAFERVVCERFPPDYSDVSKISGHQHSPLIYCKPATQDSKIAGGKVSVAAA